MADTIYVFFISHLSMTVSGAIHRRYDTPITLVTVCIIIDLVYIQAD